MYSSSSVIFTDFDIWLLLSGNNRNILNNKIYIEITVQVFKIMNKSLLSNTT